jgi:hypothetical protein
MSDTPASAAGGSGTTGVAALVCPIVAVRTPPNKVSPAILKGPTLPAKFEYVVVVVSPGTPGSPLNENATLLGVNPSVTTPLLEFVSREPLTCPSGFWVELGGFCVRFKVKVAPVNVESEFGVASAAEKLPRVMVEPSTSGSNNEDIPVKVIAAPPDDAVITFWLPGSTVALDEPTPNDPEVVTRIGTADATLDSTATAAIPNPKRLLKRM